MTDRLLYPVISSSEKSFSSPFPSFFAKPFTGSTVHLSAIRCFRFLLSDMHHNPKEAM